MFTGLVEGLGTVVALIDQPPGVLLEVRHPAIAASCGIGASVAINGCCLTVVAREQDRLSFEAGSETLSRTNLGRLRAGHAVNLERSIRAGDPLGGHFVTGHIDCLGHLDARLDEGDWSTCWFSFPTAWGRHLASKGSIAVDGVSLTVVDVEPTRFSVALIPHTLEVTTLGRLQAGDPVNLETDVLAKYVEAALGRGERPTWASGPTSQGSHHGA